MNPPPTYTAAQIAKAIGITPRAVRMRLAGVVADGSRQVNGKSASAWSLAVLPIDLQQTLAALAQQRGCQGATDLLSDPVELWQPAKPWHLLAPAFRENAEKLSRALAPLLAQQHTLSDLMERAAIAYRQNFGNEISADKLRYVMDRATQRDRGFQQWHRPDLFLDEAAFSQAEISTLTMNGIHASLDPHVAEIKDRQKPSLSDRAYLFHFAFEHLESLASRFPSKGDRRAAKASLVEYLLNQVPGFYRPQATDAGGAAEKPFLAVRRAFNRDYGQWIAGGRKVAALLDAREQNSGREGYRCQPCEVKIEALAVELRGKRGKLGNVSQAIKILFAKGELCEGCRPRLESGRISNALRQRVTPNKIQIAERQGPRFLRNAAPTHHNDWSDTAPGDRFVIDDMTPNELVWDEVNGETIHGQAQMLFTEDEASSMPLDFYLYIGAPNSITIKKAVAMVLRNHGMPHVSLLTERGVFNNRMLIGDGHKGKPIPLREMQAALSQHFDYRALSDEELKRVRQVQLGLRDPAIGLKIQQATTPQAKSVERTFNNFQNRAVILPAHAGFNQRNEMPKYLQDFQRRVATGKEHPGNEYMSLVEMRKNYNKIWDELAHRPVNGIRHRGQSAVEYWNEAMQQKPLRVLPAEIEPLLATHRIPDLKVRSEGLCVRLNKFENAFYFNGMTGELVDRRVSVYIDYDHPEYVHIEHPTTGKLLKVERAFTKRRTASKEELNKVSAARRAHIAGARGEAGNLVVQGMIKSWVVRDTEFADSDKDKGAQIAADLATHQATVAKAKREDRALRTKAAALGSQLPSNIKNTARVREGVDLEAEALREIAAMEKSADNQKP